MLTRSQVARRLGKSVATVRRIEGVLLAPMRDRRGIYRFEEDEVADLVRDIDRGDVSLWQEMSDATEEGCSRLTTDTRERDSRAHDVGATTQQADALERQNKAAAERISKLEHENQSLRSQARNLSRLLVAVSSAAELEALPHEILVSLLECAD
jgi:hypothetical protein